MSVRRVKVTIKLEEGIIEEEFFRHNVKVDDVLDAIRSKCFLEGGVLHDGSVTLTKNDVLSNTEEYISFTGGRSIHKGSKFLCIAAFLILLLTFYSSFLFSSLSQ